MLVLRADDPRMGGRGRVEDVGLIITSWLILSVVVGLASGYHCQGRCLVSGKASDWCLERQVLGVWRGKFLVSGNTGV